MPEIKVRCTKCQKRFRGKEDSIRQVRSCLRCNATGDWWTLMETFAGDSANRQHRGQQSLQLPNELQPEYDDTSIRFKHRSIFISAIVVSAIAMISVLVSVTYWYVADSGEMIKTVSDQCKIDNKEKAHRLSLLKLRVSDYRHALLSDNRSKLEEFQAPWERSVTVAQKIKITGIEIDDFQLHESGFAATVLISGEGRSKKLPFVKSRIDGENNWIWIDGVWYVAQMELEPLAAIASPNEKGGRAAASLQKELQNRFLLHQECIRKSSNFLQKSNYNLARSKHVGSIELKEYLLDTAKKYVKAASDVNSLSFKIAADDKVLAKALKSLKIGILVEYDLIDWNTRLQKVEVVGLGEAPADIVTCSRCSGTGRINKTRSEMNREMQGMMGGALNRGSGSHILPPIETHKRCPKCGGDGTCRR